AVVGGGDASMEEADFLTKFASKVHLIARRPKEHLRASKIMQERVMSNSKIEIIYNSEIKEVLGDNFVSGVRLLNNQTNEESVLEVQGLFVAIGHTPNTAFLKGFIDLDEKGYIKVEQNTRSSKEGVFIAGDVADHRYRQAITAAGMGCMASIDVEKYLADKSEIN
ncbi:FAD-dependent oxidoreductase, partial [candidate division WWE3 bacterium]|nr:FAD-dependent oxidoreductase [candidate division WWE3 bacterium]